MMDASAEYPSEKSEKDELTVFIDKIEAALGGIIGTKEPRDQIEFMRECEDTDEVIDYLMGLLIHYEIDSKEFLKLIGVLEPDDETE